MASSDLKKQLSRARVESNVTTPPTTPTPVSKTAHQLLSDIRGIYQDLRSLSSLVPCEKVNAHLTRLVKLCILPYDPDLIAYFFSIEGTGKICESLQSICATAEGELESFWACKILRESTIANACQTKAVLQTFPYYQNYLDLSRLEACLLSAFRSKSTKTSRIAFIGSGPLPLTSLCLLDAFPTSTIHNIDRDDAALQISRKLTDRLGYSGRMTFGCEDVSIPTDTHWSDFDVVFLAALVGMDSAAKLRILESLVRSLQPGALIIARSARGIRSVLYPVLELGDDLFNAGFEVLAEVHPWTGVVNSVIVLRVKERFYSVRRMLAL